MKKLRTWLADERGMALIITAFSFSILLGFMALAIDVGLLFRARRNVQIAADAAATAGALDYFNTSSSSSAHAAAQNASTANGITNGAGGAVVTVINPVTSGPHTGSDVVEVDITQPNPTYFMRIFGFNSVNVAAKAVAGSSPGPCIYLMNTTGSDLNLTGSATIEGVASDGKTPATGCGIYSNSDVSVSGNSNLVNMAYVAAAGTITGTQNTNPAPVITNAPQEKPPAALLVAPPDKSTISGGCNLPPPCYPTVDTSQCTVKTNSGVTSYTITISSMSANTCYGVDNSPAPTTSVLNLTISSATLAAGNYGFDLGTASTGPNSFGGTLTIGSNVRAPSDSTNWGPTPPQPADGSGADGISLDIYTGNFSVSATSTNDYLYASTLPTNPYSGILILEPSTNKGTINLQWGSATGAFVGIIDATGANLTLQDSGGATLVTGLIVGSLTTGPSTINIENYSSVFTNSPLNSVALVE